MKRKSNIAAILAAVMLALAPLSCAKVGRVSILDVKIVRIVPQSLKTISGIMQMQVRNEGPAFDIQSADATVLMDGSPLCTMTFEPVSVKGETTEWVDVKPTATISDGVSLLQLMTLVNNYDVNRLSVSYSVTAKIGLFTRKKAETDVPLSKFLKK